MTIFSNAPVIPGVTWDERDYARLRLTLALYDDMIVATRPALGSEPSSTFVVDPLDIAQRLAGLPVESGLLPRNCLWWQRRRGQERLAVYVPPQVWPVNIAGGERLTVPLPGLVFAGQGQRYTAWAVTPPDDAPAGWLPDAGTELYHAPTPNVGSNGVCAGNVAFPVAGAATIWQAVNLFFESGFNDHLSNNKSQQHPRSVLPLWRELSDAGAEAYPLGDLVATRKIVKQVMEANSDPV